MTQWVGVSQLFHQPGTEKTWEQGGKLYMETTAWSPLTKVNLTNDQPASNRNHCWYPILHYPLKIQNSHLLERWLDCIPTLDGAVIHFNINRHILWVCLPYLLGLSQHDYPGAYIILIHHESIALSLHLTTEPTLQQRKCNSGHMAIPLHGVPPRSYCSNSNATDC